RNLPAAGEVGAGEQVAGLATVDAADERFLVVEAAEEEHLPAEGQKRFEHLPQLHLLAFAPGPPFLAVKAVAREETGEAHRRLRGAFLRLLISPDRDRLQPRQRHRHADAAQEGPAGKGLEAGG